MPTWEKVRQEIENQNRDIDGVRRAKIRAVENITKRPLLVYAVDFLRPEKAAHARGQISIDLGDKLPFDEATTNLVGSSIDVLIHSPGGSPEATESIVNLLRSRFSDIRFIIPYAAKSAATMMACSGNSILVDERSEIGPIDPQLVIFKEGGSLSVPAQAILDQFERAQKEIQRDNKRLPAWVPLLHQFGPAFLSQCETATKLALELASNWLEKYMGKTPEEAQEIATFLSTHSNFSSHGRHVGIDEMISIGLNIHDLRATPELREAVWELYCAIDWTFEWTSAFKLVENGQGDAYIRSVQVLQIPVPGSLHQHPAPQPSPPVSDRRRRRQGQR